jgi:hypothetical protein
MIKIYNLSMHIEGLVVKKRKRTKKNHENHDIEKKSENGKAGV